MKHKISIVKMFFFAMVIIFVTYANAQNAKNILYPKKECAACYVSNADRLLSDTMIKNLNAKLVKFERETSVQVTIVVLKGDKQTDARSLPVDLFDLWGVVAKGKTMD